MSEDKSSEAAVLETERGEIVNATAGASTQRDASLSFFQGISLVVGLQIGSGIFASPNQVHIHAGSAAASLLVWIVSGLLAWTGASCYAELGSAIPRSGGAKAYLQYIYGDYAAFLFSWTALTVLKPGSAAIIASILGEYVSKDAVIKRVAAVVAVLITTVANGVGIGASASTFFLVLKFVLLLAVLIASIVLTTRHFAPESSFWSGTNNIGELAMGLYGGIWAYDGWDNLNFVAGEMRDAKRDLPRVIATAMPLVITAYVIVNLGYFGALSSSDLDASTSVALTIASKLNSRALGVVLSTGIVLSCAGALNATMFSVAKLVQLVAEDRVLPQALTKHAFALAFQAGLTIVFVCIGEFHTLVQFYGAMGTLFYLVVVCGLLRLRWTEPQLARPYRSWLIAPVIFILLTAALLLRTAIKYPLIIPGNLAFFLLGSPIYWFAQRSKKASEQSPAQAQDEELLRDDAEEFELDDVTHAARPGSSV